jgi:hypothetical protein
LSKKVPNGRFQGLDTISCLRGRLTAAKEIRLTLD